MALGPTFDYVVHILVEGHNVSREGKIARVMNILGRLYCHRSDTSYDTRTLSITGMLVEQSYDEDAVARKVADYIRMLNDGPCDVNISMMVIEHDPSVFVINATDKISDYKKDENHDRDMQAIKGDAPITTDMDASSLMF